MFRRLFGFRDRARFELIWMRFIVVVIVVAVKELAVAKRVRMRAIMRFMRQLLAAERRLCPVPCFTIWSGPISDV